MRITSVAHVAGQSGIHLKPAGAIRILKVATGTGGLRPRPRSLECWSSRGPGLCPTSATGCARASPLRSKPMSETRAICVGTLVLLGGCVGGYKPDLNSPDPAARIRAIRQVTEKHDSRAIPLLVDRLEDEDEAVRFYAIAALTRMTGTDMGYKYYQPAYERLPAVRRWRRYVRERNDKATSTQTARSGQ
jgi:hypothetical protein